MRLNRDATVKPIRMPRATRTPTHIWPLRAQHSLPRLMQTVLMMSRRDASQITVRSLAELPKMWLISLSKSLEKKFPLMRASHWSKHVTKHLRSNALLLLGSSRRSTKDLGLLGFNVKCPTIKMFRATRYSSEAFGKSQPKASVIGWYGMSRIYPREWRLILSRISMSCNLENTKGVRTARH